MSRPFSHIDSNDAPAMVDVGHKVATSRSATAQSSVRFPAEVAAALAANGFNTAKGPVFHTAIIAGTQAAKRTHELIPFCHPLGLEDCQVKISVVQNKIIIDTEAVLTAKTGVEMEALTAASIAALTVYDMCKALSHNIVIEEIKLMEKTGGKKDFKRA